MLPPIRRCNVCTEELPLTGEFFHVNRGKHHGGFCHTCKPCARERARHYSRTTARQRRLARYGVTEEQIARHTVCEACQSPGVWVNTPGAPNLVVDHDHTSGRYRGVLCNNCNVALGLVADDANRLMALALYIERTREQT